MTDAATRDYAPLLAAGRIGPVETRNRIVMAPMGANLAEADGRPGERMQRYFELRARGGVGLIVVDVGAVAWPVGASNPHQLALSREDQLPDLTRLVERIHAHGAKVAVQLHHGGKVAVRDIVAGRAMWVPSPPRPGGVDLYDDLSAADRQTALGDFVAAGNAPEYHEMSTGDIEVARTWFVDAADRAARAGFDGIELHAGHGYLPQSFLSPATNRREDLYGGSVEHRARFVCEILEAIRARVGSSIGMWLRLDGREHGVDGGITIDDACRTAALAADAGADAVHVSAYADPTHGAAFTVAPLPDEPGAYLADAARVRRTVEVPVIAVGRIDPDRASDAIAASEADFVAMGRRLLADPELPRRLADGTARRARPCIYSYRCVGNVFLGQRATCVVNPTMGREHERDPDLVPTAEPRRVVVVGGGPAGMETARLAAARGHDVTLFERGAVLGGQARIAAVADEAIGGLLDWWHGELGHLGVDIRVESSVTADDLTGAEIVVDARGRARRQAPAATTRFEDLDPGQPGAGPVVVLGDDGPALQVAAWFARLGRVVHLVGEDDHVGGQLAPPKLWQRLAQVRANGTVLKLAVIHEIGPGYVDLTHDGERRRIDVEDVVVVGTTDPDDPSGLSNPPTSTALPATVELHRVGDAASVRGLDGVFEDAWTLATRL